MVSARTKSTSILLAGVAFVLGSNDPLLGAEAFSTSSSARTRAPLTTTVRGHSDPVLFSMQQQHDVCESENSSPSESRAGQLGRQAAATTLAASLAVVVASTTLPANAYLPSDYASDTVQTAIKDLKTASGKADETFKVYEGIAAIITEGRGVGGQINYKGVELNRGYVADEDTSIYNPGLSLLTESEKERLVEGVIAAKKAGLVANQWSEENEYAFEFLRTKLDPYHMVELSGFLGFVPYYGAAIYVVVLAVQQLFRDAFQIAYLVGVAAFFLPLVGLVLAGP